MGLLVATPPAGPWESFFPADEHLGARAAYFLLHRDQEQENDAETFVTHTLERILQQLAIRSDRELIEYQGRVRGQIVWPATLKSRYTGDYDPTRYVCREVRRRFDTPENQLLRYTVESIWRALERVPYHLRSGRCYHSAQRRFEPATIGEQLKAMELVLPRLRKHAKLRGVTLVEAITPEHLLRAQCSKLEEYGLVADLYERLYETTISSSWEGVAKLGRQSLPMPDRLAAETEPWIRLAAAVQRG